MCDTKDRSDTFTNPNYSSYILNIMYTLYRGKKFCDAEIGVGNKRFLAHSVVMASSSAYLNAQLENNSDPIKQIFLEDLNEAAVLAMIEYCYTGVIEMRTATVADILTVAGLFQIDPVIKSCCKFMTTVLSVSNCFQFSEIGELYGCDDLVKLADDFMSENFKRISRTEQFLKIGENQLKRLLNKNLSVSTEYEILKSVERWFYYDSEKRKNHMTSLLKIIRLPLISSQVISDEVQPMCRNIADCQSLIIQALVYKHLPSTKLNPDIHWNIPRPYDSTIVVIGCYFQENAGIMDIYDPKENKWRQYLDTQINRRTANAVYLDDEVIIIGGFNNDGIRDTVEGVNLKTGKKRTLPSLQTPRFGAVATVVNGFIYVIGGVNSTGTLGSVEKYDPKKQQWSYSAPMITPREGCGIGVLDNEIFVIGGWNKFKNVENQGETTVEAFCPFTEKWRSCGPLNEKRHWVSAAVAGNVLYAVGGRLSADPNSLRYKSIEVYSPFTDSWSFIAELNVARFGIACGTLNNKLVAVGGCRSQTVEAYDPTVNKWNPLADCPSYRENSTLVHVPLSYLERHVTLN